MIPRTIDADQHLFELRDTWRARIDPASLDDALAIEDDELGYAWLTWRGERLYLAESQRPGDPHAIGALRARVEAGLPAEHGFDDVVPPEYHDAGARAAALDRFGLDAAVVFPNYGLLWERMLGADLSALLANMRAANRWMADAVADGGGRLFGVAHVSLRDRAWVRDELAALERAGIRLAMVAAAPVDGRALSHPELDPVWAAFVEHGVSPVFHVASAQQPFHPAWYANDPERVDSLLDSVFLSTAPAVAIADLILNGTFDRHPDLRVGVVELTAGWVPTFMLHLDGASDFYAARHGRLPHPLALRPSEYVRRHVRVAALSYEGPGHLISRAGDDLFLFGSDWPHAEGVAEPLADYERAVPALGEPARSKLFGGNAAWLLRLGG